RVEKWAVKIMQRNRIAYFDGVGEAAFYAPKMDLMATDALGREWQLSTVQIDFVMPERFDLKYVNAQGKEERPVMIHRAILGSTERFMMILLEHYAGALPLWLSPIQVRIASVGKDHQKFCHDLSVKFQNESIRTDVDDNNETIGNKIRKASHEKVPYTLVIGDKEMQSGKLAVRIRGAQKIVEMESKAFIDRLKKSISERASALDL
ncbi:MAG: His/Gly/Thr/Pro-type tRNA ligase C-terminal domain-containing protein, partial [Patescibacteria group bacterium]